jgi:kinetochore protein Nuf2
VLFSISEAKRTSRFLSGIINFIHFREECRGTYMEFLKQYVRFKQIGRIVNELLICLEEMFVTDIQLLNGPEN